MPKKEEKRKKNLFLLGIIEEEQQVCVYVYTQRWILWICMYESMYISC